MPTALSFVEDRLTYAENVIETSPTIRGPGDYKTDPVGYARDILGITTLTVDQEDILRSLLVFPYRVLVPSGHSLGKSFIAAVAINWWYDSFDPGVCISMAPTKEHVEDVLWAEIRAMRQRAGLPGLMPAAPVMKSGPQHYAKGLSANRSETVHGRHLEYMLFVFDEATAVDPAFWEGVESMFSPQPGMAWLCIFNPMRTNCQAYLEDHLMIEDEAGNRVPKWKRIHLDCLRHPNIVGKGRNDVPEIRGAITWNQINDKVQSFCERIPEGQPHSPADLEWPIGSGRWWKQGTIFLIRFRGLWPTGAMESVWSEHLWSLIENRFDAAMPRDLLPEIGCDVARFGDDFTSTHVRWGSTSVFHHSVEKRDLATTRMALMGVANEWAEKATKHRDPKAKPIEGKDILIKVDDDGLGGGVVDELRKAGYRVVGVGAGTTSISGNYINKRSELWFQIADRALAGEMGLGLIDKGYRDRMRQQALAVTWQMSAGGKRTVEPKEWTKEMIGRSPDDMDAVNLAYLEGVDFGRISFIEGQAKRDPFTITSTRRKVFGS